jgi:hypothetical protein
LIPLHNGTQLKSLAELIRFGRETWPANSANGKFILAELLGTGFDLVAADAACYAKGQHYAGWDASEEQYPDWLAAKDLQHSGSDVPCGSLMRHYSHSVCAALKQAGLDWWIMDPTAMYAAEDLDRPVYLGLGAAQLIRYTKSLCSSSGFNVALTVGWVMHGQPGTNSYLYVLVLRFLWYVRS